MPVGFGEMSILERFRLDDRVVIVTGASAGLGVAFAQAFAQAGGTFASIFPASKHALKI